MSLIIVECVGSRCDLKVRIVIAFLRSEVNVENFLEEIGKLTSVDIIQAFEEDVTDCI